MKTVTLKGVTYGCPSANLLRPLTAEEWPALAKDIRSRGVLMPVVVADENNVIDGHNRLEVAAEVRLADCPVKMVAGLVPEQTRGGGVWAEAGEG